jgi:hypothetical protein
MSDLLNTAFSIIIIIFIVSLFTDPVVLARDVGATLSSVAIAFYEGFTQGQDF